MKRFRFKKRYDSREGSIPEGSDITVMDNGALYFNAGLVHPAYRSVLKSLIDNKELRDEYLVEEVIPYNKV